MVSKELSLKFFIKMLGYHPEKRKGERVFVKCIGRRRFSVVSEETLKEEYQEVCKRLNLNKEDYAK